MTHPTASRLRITGIYRRTPRTSTFYRLTDRLHEGRAVTVPGEKIATIVSAWLAELGTHSPLVDDLERAVTVGDWPATHALAEYLSVDVVMAA